MDFCTCLPDRPLFVRRALRKEYDYSSDMDYCNKEDFKFRKCIAYFMGNPSEQEIDLTGT